MNCVSCDICVYHLELCVFFPGVYLSSRVTGACPVTMDLIMRDNVRTTTTTSDPYKESYRRITYSEYIIRALKPKKRLELSGTNDSTELYVPPNTHTETTHQSTLERNMEQRKNQEERIRVFCEPRLVVPRKGRSPPLLLCATGFLPQTFSQSPAVHIHAATIRSFPLASLAVSPLPSPLSHSSSRRIARNCSSRISREIARSMQARPRRSG